MCAKEESKRRDGGGGKGMVFFPGESPRQPPKREKRVCVRGKETRESAKKKKPSMRVHVLLSCGVGVKRDGKRKGGITTGEGDKKGSASTMNHSSNIKKAERRDRESEQGKRRDTRG